MARNDRVAVLVFPPVSLFEMSVACEVFGLDRRDMGVPSYDLRVCSFHDAPLRTENGVTLDTPHRLEALRWADTISSRPIRAPS
jgi:transcriptional regulator GlxA family with amidase domain